jgi:maleylacetoacetate isomerase/maleylpyruvate isomerase
MIRLHDFPLSSASYRVRIALNLKGVAYERRNYVLREGEQRSADYLAINPAGLVPCLEIDGLRLTQSLAIVEYLDSRFPEPRLIPQDPALRARAQAMALTVACDIHPLNNLRVLQFLERDLQQDSEQVNRWYAHWIDQGFSALEAMLKDGPEEPFAMGDTVGIADLCLVPQVFNARRFAVDLTPYPRLVAIADRAAALPAFADAAPGTQP